MQKEQFKTLETYQINYDRVYQDRSWYQGLHNHGPYRKKTHAQMKNLKRV